MPDDVTRLLRDAYDSRVVNRDARPAPEWETGERNSFLQRLRGEQITRLLELGAATGADSEFFQANGIDVVCVDLSPEMVKRCRNRGLEAHVMDVANLYFTPGSFGAVYAMNCLGHVPKTQVPGVLERVRSVLRPEGLFYVGIYGGREFEGVWDDDHYEPKRFFNHYLDGDLREVVERAFQVESFRSIPQGWNGLHFQSVTARKPG